MSLLPYILGIIPLVLFWLCPANLPELKGIFLGMASPYPDSYTVYQIIKQVPKDKKVQNYENDIYYI